MFQEGFSREDPTGPRGAGVVSGWLRYEWNCVFSSQYFLRRYSSFSFLFSLVREVTSVDDSG